MSPDTGPEAAKEGILEDVKGKAKEVVGRVTGSEGMTKEGEAQQARADADREAAEKEAEAERARSEASLHEAEQRRHQS